MQALIKNGVVIGLMDCDEPTEITNAINNTHADVAVYVTQLDVLPNDVFDGKVFSRDGKSVGINSELAEAKMLLEDATALLLETGVL